MNNIEFLNSILQLIVVLFVICLAVNIIIMRKIPFLKINNDYVGIIDLIRYVLKFLSTTIFAIILTIFIYSSFSTSTINVADIKNEVTFLVLLMVGAFIVVLWFNTIITGANFIYKLIYYIKLRRNTISNNLRHAIAKKDDQSILKNYNLINQTDEIIKLSKNEISILTACLSKHGYNEDVKELLITNLYKKQSVLSKMFTTNSALVEYNIQSNDDIFVPSNTMKHKLKHFENITTIISIVMTVVFFLQFIIVTFSETFHIPNNIMLVFVILTSVFIIGLILIKHEKIKKLYRKELAIANLPSDHIKVRKPIIDNILLGISAFMIVNVIVQVLIY
ncbi:hypothetical protein [Staphylococcus shinii]|uniref:hypothetical protein n=1 Tax=Staphylococcus shinii TaxID=2912228 RepID=UPI003F578CF8